MNIKAGLNNISEAWVLELCLNSKDNYTYEL